ncbi:MAG: hypothetical protein ABFD75_07335 [Smithella sp.]
MLPRIQLFEFCERSGTPRWIRDSIVEIIGTGLRTSSIFKTVAPIFHAFRQLVCADEILDLGSGSGEPAALLIEELHRQGFAPPRIILSDLFPNLPQLQKTASLHPDHLQVIDKPLDAAAIPEQFNQPLRTIINTFHHFPPPLASKILADAIQKQRAIFIMESFPRNLYNCWELLPNVFRSYWQNPARTEQDRLRKVIFSYIIPLIGICFTWDSLISIVRVYNEVELRKMASDVGGKNYTWVYEELAYSSLGRAVVFYGYPSKT